MTKKSSHFISSTFLWKKVEPKPLTAQGAFPIARLSRMAPRLSPSQPPLSRWFGLLGFRHAPRAAGRQSGDKTIYFRKKCIIQNFPPVGLCTAQRSETDRPSVLTEEMRSCTALHTCRLFQQQHVCSVGYLMRTELFNVRIKILGIQQHKFFLA